MAGYLRISVFAFVFILMISSAVCLSSPIQQNTVITEDEPEDSADLFENTRSNMETKIYENKGQLEVGEIEYYSYLESGIIGFGPSSISIWIESSNDPIALEFPGSQVVKPSVSGLEGFSVNYFLGNSEPVTNVKVFARITYEDLWPGISLVYHTSSGEMKYEFIVDPGADPEEIVVHSSNHISLRTTGDTIILQNEVGEIRDSGLFCHQEENEIESRFELLDKDTYGFEIGDFDNSKQLIIDPIIYSSYFGGMLSDTGHSVAIDYKGNAYIVGDTISLDFPCFNAYSSTNSGDKDCILLKVNPSGALIFATYIGGSRSDSLLDVVVDGGHNVYLAGQTNSYDFPTMRARNKTLAGDYDCVVLKMNATGNALSFSTYIGGSGADIPNGIVLDNNNNIYVTGRTTSSDFPVVNAYSDAFHGELDIFVFKISPNGESLEYSTYVGGSSQEYGTDIAVDDLGNAYVVGSTQSGNMPIMKAYQSTKAFGTDCYLFKLNATGNGLIIGTYIGGSLHEFAEGIRLDSHNNMIIAGQTTSSDFPVVNGYDLTHNGYLDSFVLKMNRTGYNLIFSSFLGGSSYDDAAAMDIDPLGNIYVVGQTNSADFPLLNPLNDSNMGGYDIFALKMNSTGTGLAFSTYIGAADYDGGFGIAIGGNSLIFITGETHSTEFPVVNPFDSSSSDDEGFIFATTSLDDSDVDGLGDSDEVRLGTNPFAEDSDSDAIPDGWEVFHGLNPLSNDTDADLDGDSLTNIQEYLANTHPNRSDTDYDFLSDYQEVNVYSTDPNNPDSDYDRLIDGFEVLSYMTDPNDDDSDNDLIPDGWEVENGINPIEDDSTEDPDFDTLENLDEYLYCCDPLGNDTDSDTLLDGYEVHIHGTSPTNIDSDSDTMVDGWEVSFGLLPTVDDAAEDPDSDTLSNIEEYGLGTFPNNNDTDSDMMPDGWEVSFSLNPLTNDSLGDLDSDLLLNLEEYQWNCLPNDIDTDNDGLSDGEEVHQYGCIPTDTDSDDDTLWDYAEVMVHHTNPTSSDTDGDSLSDPDEIQVYFTNATLSDTDSDALDDYVEIFVYQTDPNNSDSDGDLIEDGAEVNTYLTNPLDSDSDDDEIPDGTEINIYGTNPLLADSDADTMPDLWEIENSLDPLVNDAALDPDGDTLSNGDEYSYNVDPQNPDSDNDTLSDGSEVHIYGTDPSRADTDRDSLDDAYEIEVSGTDPLDTDSDDDYLSDYSEIMTYYTDPLNPDTDGDGASDGAEVALGMNPLVPDFIGDTDGDGLSDVEEYALGTDRYDQDSDNDGLLDGWEVSRGLDPLEYTTRTGEAIERLLITLIAGFGLFAGVFMLILRTKERFDSGGNRITTKKPLFVPAIVFLVVVLVIVTFDVHGPIDPGANVKEFTSSVRFEVKDSPYLTNTIRIYASYEMEIVETTHVDITFRGPIINSTTLTIRSTSPFVQIESDSASINLPIGNYTVSVRSSRTVDVKLTQVHIDAANDDQKAWLFYRFILLISAIGLPILTREIRLARLWES